MSKHPGPGDLAIVIRTDPGTHPLIHVGTMVQCLDWLEPGIYERVSDPRRKRRVGARQLLVVEAAGVVTGRGQLITEPQNLLKISPDEDAIEHMGDVMAGAPLRPYSWR